MEIKFNKLEFGYRLKTVRESKNISIKDAAKALGLKVKTLKNWEKGYNLPSLKNLVNCCNFYNVSIGSLLEYKII